MRSPALPSRTRARAARLGFVEAEHRGAVGQEVEAAEAVKVAHLVDPEPARLALIGQARIEEAVAQHPLPAVERGADRLVDMVGARRGEQQGLGARVPARLVALQQQRADRLGIGAAAGLAGDDDRQPAPLERRGERVELGRLARPLPAFEADEPPARHVRLTPCRAFA